MHYEYLSRSLDRLREQNAWFRKSADPGISGRVCTGVNVAGYFRDESGWGSAGRRYLQAIKRSHLDHSLCDLSSITSNRSLHTEDLKFDNAFPYDINLVCVDARQHYGMLAVVGERFFEGRYNIGAWAWELPTFPEELFDRFAYYDEIWVGTSFIADVLAPISPVPVVVMPPVLDIGSAANPIRGRKLIDAADDETIFLFIFDVHSHLARKNPFAVIEAFRAAFKSTDRARLVLKCVNETADPEGFASLQAAAAGAAIDIRTGYWSAENIRDLTAGCDAYVSLHRSEGTGLTISDAMSLGRPVIATDWSGNTDFMDVSCSYPVRYKLTEIEQTVGPYRKGQTWAQPEVEHAGSLMRAVHEQPDDARQIGIAAQQRLRRQFSCEAVANRVQQRLTTIAALDKYESYCGDIKEFYRSYQSLVADIRTAATSLVPAGEQVLVVSKGDPELLSQGGATASHFPSTPEGIYCGHHPPDSEWAVAQLEEARQLGAAFLLIPGTSRWWLDHYKEFAAHLRGYYQVVTDTAEFVLYDLRSSSCAGLNAGRPSCRM